MSCSQNSLYSDDDEQLQLALEVSLIDACCSEQHELTQAVLESQRDAVRLRRLQEVQFSSVTPEQSSRTVRVNTPLKRLSSAVGSTGDRKAASSSALHSIKRPCGSPGQTHADGTLESPVIVSDSDDDDANLTAVSARCENLSTVSVSKPLESVLDSKLNLFSVSNKVSGLVKNVLNGLNELQLKCAISVCFEGKRVLIEGA